MSYQVNHKMDAEAVLSIVIIHVAMSRPTRGPIGRDSKVKHGVSCPFVISKAA
jgi:hypothetical protein